ncbi:MAG: hypothetical protein EHM33_05915 [Chloroflexi bacterium]|nr:MAG: hypothetical protein EHM33_05915 [Chloroflexota bacterium]
MKPNVIDGTVDPAQITQALIEILSKGLGGENIQKTQTAGNPIGPYIHGPGGLFGIRGLSQDVISTHTQFTGSLGELLPIQGSRDTNPLFPYITGYLRSDQQEKNLVCDDPPEANHFKTCIQTTQFGRKEFKTRQAEINRIGQRLNRGEFMDLRIVNSPLVPQMAGLMGNIYGNGLSQQNQILAGREMVARLVEVVVAFQRWFCPHIFTGNPSNNSAGGGYKEFPGLDLLISTTKVDVETGTSCPSLYSDIKDFNYQNVSSNADPNIVRTLTTMYRILTRKAVQQGMAPVDLRIVMREPLFYELTRAWPCQYNTDGCAVGQSNTQEVNMNDAVRFRDDLRNNRYLLIDGRKVPVILDDCIMEETTSDNDAIPLGGFSSDIYFVPFSIMGGSYRTLYMEYYDYRNDVLPAAGDAHALPTFFWSDNGVALWSLKAPDNWCIEVISKIEPRLILRTPQLAGRLQNVVYIPLQHTDDPLPSQDYHVNGGVTTGRPFPSPFSEWNLGGPGVGA